MTTSDKIQAILDHHDIQYTALPGGVIFTGFGTEHYHDLAGRAGVPIFISIHEGGAYVSLDVPGAYHIPAKHPYRDAAFQALLEVEAQSKMLRFGYDPRDGEVRASVSLPLMDAELGDAQLLRALTAIPDLLDRNDALIRGAIENGMLERSKPSAAESLAALAAFATEWATPEPDGGAVPEDIAAWARRGSKPSGLN
jgi:hypothetical protein